jgi:DNA topoisomerase-2
MSDVDMPPMCHVYIKVRIKFLVSECFWPYVLKPTTSTTTTTTTTTTTNNNNNNNNTFQVWGSNMAKASEPRIKDYTGEDFTKISFSPDLSKFQMETLDKDIVALMSRRAFDVAASTRGVKVYLNGKRLPVGNLQ